MNNKSLNKNIIDDNSFVYFGIDKITLGIESRFLNFKKSPDCLSHVVDIVNHGNWSKLHIQLETNGMSNIYFDNPFLSVIYALQLCINSNFFIETLTYRLNYFIYMIYFGMFHPYSFIIHFFDTGIFTLDEYELYFDFYGYNPILSFNEDNYISFKNSVYSNDFKISRRSDGEMKGKRRSMLCFYKRGHKIGSQYNINRLEFRLCDERAKAILRPSDIFLSVPCFIECRGNQIRQTLKRYMPIDSIRFDKDYIKQKIPILGKLIWLL
jgi:hypothetical protein